MSKDLKKRKVQEPWEQSIYEPNQGDGRTRAEKRRGKKGNTVFLTVLVILLFLIIAIPVGTYIYITHDKKAAKEEPETSSSLVQSSDTGIKSSSSTSPSSSSPSTIDDDDNQNPEQSQQVGQQTNDANGTTPENSVPQNQNAQTPNDPATESGTQAVVGAGDNPQKIANQYGLTLQEFYQLNPGVNETNLQIGQSVRVK